MADYIFKTHVTVSADILETILTDYRNRVIEDLILDDTLEFSDYESVQIVGLMEKVAAAMVDSNQTSVDGWTLTSNEIAEIADHLRNFKRIDAIKTFRQATGAGLKDGKDFIDSFCAGDNNTPGPVAASRLAEAFNK
jgi:ribosomal protein L7/L12